jgi:carbon-monoxide dehydrogenase large subunit
MAPRFVGQSVQRNEDPRLLSGRGRYVDDVRLPRMLHAAFLRSDVARARVTRIDVASARQLAGVHAVYTASELQPMVRGPLAATMYLSAPIATLSPLGGPEIRFAGEAVALVVAESRYVAEDACELIDVDFDVLEPVVDYEVAANDTVNIVHSERGTNVMSRIGSGAPDADAELASARYVVTETFYQARQSQAPMETHGIVASWDPFEQDLRVWASSQRVQEIRATLARVTGVADHRIHVTQRDVGGAFGQKGSMRTEEVAVVLAALDLAAPVKWIEDRHENLLAGGHARADRVAVTMGVDDEGHIVAAHLDHLEDQGAYPAGGSVGALVAMMFPGPYHMGRVSWESTAVFTNTCGRLPYRGPWNAESLAREQMMDHVARAIGMDPVEFRRRNVIGGDEMPFRNASGMTYANIDPAAVLEHALEVFDYSAFRREQARALAEGRRIGVGISLFVEPTALGAGSLIGTEAAHVRITPSGKVSVALGTGSHGQGIATTMAQIAADELGVHVDDVVVVDGDTDTAPMGGGTGGSRSGVIGGAATHLAAAEVREKILTVAAELLEAAPDDLELADGQINVRGSPTKAVTLAEVASVAYTMTNRLPAGVEAGLEAMARYSTPGITFAIACHICTVEVHDDGRCAILRYVVSEDCGVLINPAIVRGQICGGIVQGIGSVLHEQFRYDDAGNPLTTTFLDYLIPTASDVPTFEIGHLGTPGPGPGGYKGVGEGGAIGAVPAVRNAISDALGVTITCAVRPGDLVDLLSDGAASKPAPNGSRGAVQARSRGGVER